LTIQSITLVSPLPKRPLAAATTPSKCKNGRKGEIAKVSNDDGAEPNGKMTHKACDICGKHLLIQNPNDQDHKEMEVN